MVSSTKFCFILFFACLLFVQGTLGEVICEKLPTNLCSFAVSSSGKRCVLEITRNSEGRDAYECKTTDIDTERLSGYIETDQCVNACGVGRRFVGMSSDPFISPQFTARICSYACFRNCPNIVDLFSNLVSQNCVGLSLPALCGKVHANAQHSMAPAPSIGDGGADAPTYL